MLSINTHFHPFRLNLSRREPVQLSVEIINRGKESKMLTMELMLTRQFGLNKGGLQSGISKRIESLKPEETKLFYFDIYPKQMTRKGEHPIILNVFEHYRSFDFVERTHVKKMSLPVEE